MRVKRCGFYIENNCICQENVSIDWYDEFNLKNKVQYVRNIEALLCAEHYPCADVTSYSQDWEAKKLSIYSVQVSSMNMSFADFWNKQMVGKSTTADEIPGCFDFIYLNNLTEDNLKCIQRIDCFYDIYFNPDKKQNTVARSCIAYKLLASQNKLDYLTDMNKFMYWYYCNIGSRKIRHNEDEFVLQ